MEKKQVKNNDVVYLIETPEDIFWSKRKLTTQYKHCDFLWRDKAKYKEVVGAKFKALTQSTKKKLWELV